MSSQLEIDKEIEVLKQKLLTHELMTGILLTSLIRVVDKISPNQNAAQVLLNTLQNGADKIPESEARNDPHTKDAFTNAISTVRRALK